MRALAKISIIVLLLLGPFAVPAAQGLTIKSIRHFSYAGFTRIVFDLEAAGPYVVSKSSDNRSVVFRAYEGGLTVLTQPPLVRDGVVGSIEVQTTDGRPFIMLRLEAAAGDIKDFVLRGPDRIVLDVARGAAPAVPPPAAGAHTVVALDPGHGGPKDTGIVVPRGMEKSLTLDWAVALKKLLGEKASSIMPILIREKDQSLSLADRAAVSNAAGAAVFVALHAAPGTALRVFIQDPEDEPVTVTGAGRSDFLGFEAESGQQEMLWQRQQAAYTRESGQLGRILANELGGKRDAEPVQAPIAELRPIAAAAVLVEIGTDADASKALEAIARGIEQYVREKR